MTKYKKAYLPTDKQINKKLSVDDIFNKIQIHCKNYFHGDYAKFPGPQYFIDNIITELMKYESIKKN